MKALVWFWWIDETLSVNLVYLSDHEIGSTNPSGEANEDHIDGGDGHGDQVLGLEKKKEKNKKLKAKVKLDRSLLVWWSRHLVSVIIFRIDSRTIERGETHHGMRLSKYH